MMDSLDERLNKRNALPAPLPGQSAPPAGRRILVVESQPAMAISHAGLLEHAGYEAVLAQSAAVQLWRDQAWDAAWSADANQRIG